MNFEKDVTLVVGVDAKYFRQLEATFPVWLKLWPSLRNIPWRFFYDGNAPSLKGKINRVVSGRKHYADMKIQTWAPPDHQQYEDQRDRMLTAWTLLPPLIVQTKYWLKLDVDAFPSRQIAGSFPNVRWFESDPAIVAHSWNYSKVRGSKAEWFDILDDWYDSTSLENHPRLNLQFNGQKRLRHKRIASYAAFFNTEWTKQIAIECFNTLPDMTIPIPSQDSFLWGCAARMKKPIIRVNMKKNGISNCPSFNKLQRIIGELP